MTIRSRAVRSELASVFRTLWVRVTGARLYRMPDGCGDLVWCDGKLYACGPHRTVTDLPFPRAAHLIGFRFLPGAAAKWLGTDARDIVGVCAPLERFGKARARRLAKAAGDAKDVLGAAVRLETALAATVSAESSLDGACLGLVLDLLEGERGKDGFLRALQRSYGLSERSVRRETIKVFGYSPKTAERIWRVQRFFKTASSVRDANLAWLANAVGFADQAHMTREVRSIAGITPSEALRFARSVDDCTVNLRLQ